MLDAKVDDRLNEFFEKVKDTGKSNVEQSIVQNQGMDKLFTRCLELMMETEQRIVQSNKDMNIENGRDIQNILSKETSNGEQLASIENRLVAIEMKMSVDVQSQLEAYQNALQTMGDLNARKEVQLI